MVAYKYIILLQYYYSFPCTLLRVSSGGGESGPQASPSPPAVSRCIAVVTAGGCCSLQEWEFSCSDILRLCGTLGESRSL